MANVAACAEVRVRKGGLAARVVCAEGNLAQKGKADECRIGSKRPYYNSVC